MNNMSNNTSANDIAIVGMALRVPGAKNPEEFWTNLRNGIESIRTVSEEELLAGGETFERINHPNYIRRTADLENMDMFDADFFGLSPKEAAIMDPQHRHFLECAWEAIEDAGLLPEKQTGPVGVFAGSGMGSYFYFNVCSNQKLIDEVGMFLLRHTGNDKDFLATRASYIFDLHGPSVNIQTACSTSLVAVHQACQSLLNGECDAALAGGVTIEQPHRRGYIFQDGEILSPDGHCRPFDHRAAGTIFGSGVGVVVLRRLADAIADGDQIHAVIKATAVNNDGGGKAGYLAPSVTGQAEAIIEAQGLAGVSADTIQYVECHGTGTYLGDPIEVQALTEAFRQSTQKTGFCHIGSVKSNIGHLDTAAGVVSLIKTTLAIKHGEIPPTLGYERPNPVIPFEKSPFLVASQLTPWPSTQGPRRAAVNSLGVGGTNAHAIIEEYRTEERDLASTNTTDAPYLLLVSGRNKDAADQQMQQLGAALARNPNLSLADVSYTLATGRRAFEYRSVIAVRDRQSAITALTSTEPKHIYTHQAVKTQATAVFMFPGGGSQYAGMASSLYRHDAAFRKSVDEGLSYLPVTHANDIRHVWLESTEARDSRDRLFQRPSLQLPAILIVEVALARLWIGRGVKPAALIGHSMGENAAACIAGVLSFKDAVNLVFIRGKLFETVKPGGMLAVPLALSEVMGIKPDTLDIASINAPNLSVVSGAIDDLDTFQKLLIERDVEATRVPIDIAAHSRMIEAILSEFETFLRSIKLSAPQIPIVSNLSGAWLTDDQARDPVYWVQHLRSTVQFADGMATLAADPNRVYIEVGPGRILSSLAKAQPGVPANQVFNSLPHQAEVIADNEHFLAAIGRAWATGLDFDRETLWLGRTPRRVSLPAYPFRKKRYFIERSEIVKPAATALKRQADLADWGFQPVWKLSHAEIIAGAEKTPGCWLAFVDNSVIGKMAVQKLKELGHEVITITPGDAFSKRSKQDYSICPEEGARDYERLAGEILNDGYRPAHILHSWLVTHTETFRPGSSFFKQNQEFGFYSLLHLSRALSDAGLFDTVHIDILTNGMQRVTDEALPYPEKATILGPAMVIPKEMPGVTVRVIDLETIASPEKPGSGLFLSRLRNSNWSTREAVPEGLWDDLFAEPASEIVAYRNGKRWLRDYRRLAFNAPGDDAKTFRTGGVYLLTGGLGDLSLALAKDLVERFQAKLVLTGRTVLPDRSQWSTFRRLYPDSDKIVRAIAAIEGLERAGGSVLYIQADVTNFDDMSFAVRQAEDIFGQINGVLHTAGTVDDNLIPLKKLYEIDAVMAPKVHGTLILDRLFQDYELDLVILFSSTSTDLAPAGQIDYVAANAFLNAYAENQSQNTSRHTMAIHWGVWSEIGLAARAFSRQDDEAHAEQHLEDIDGPIFSRWVKDTSGITWLEAQLSPETCWFLNEHRLVTGQPVVPGTAYIEFIVQALREYGLQSTGIIDGLSFMRPIDVADNESRTLRVRLEPCGEKYRAIITARDNGEFAVHAEAMIAVKTPQMEKIAETALLSAAFTHAPRLMEQSVLRSIQEDHINFGPRWKVLRSVTTGDGEAIALLRLPSQHIDDLKFSYLAHPGLLDIATGFALGLVRGYETRPALWVPMTYGRIVVHANLPAEIISLARLSNEQNDADGYASFDIKLFDMNRNVIMAIEGFMMKRLDDEAAFAERPKISHQPVQVKSRTIAPAASPHIDRLAALVKQGIAPSEGFEVLLRALATGHSQPIASSIDLQNLLALAAPVAETVLDTSNTFDNAEPDRDYVAPRSERERVLAGFWSQLLGINAIGINDNFFDLGGHSLIAVRLFRMIKQEFSIDLPMSILFTAPTIAECAALIDAQVPLATSEEDAGQTPPVVAISAPAFSHLVMMDAGRNTFAKPLFLCAGMFGNIINLRQIALHLGGDRPVYGLQARGLFGDQAPHETFEDMATAYLQEIKTVQSSGPYYLGGFSGGGLIAYEMARRLTEEGETVAQLIMMDTPLPGDVTLSVADRINMKMQDIRRDRRTFVKNWIGGHIRWHREKSLKRQTESQEQSAAQFHNVKIEAAFNRALKRYQLKPYDGNVLLLRPRLDVIYRLSGGRRLQHGRKLAAEDNGWSAYVSQLTVREVPGNHDSMVLEPNARVIVARIRENLRPVETGRTDARPQQAAE